MKKRAQTWQSFSLGRCRVVSGTSLGPSHVLSENVGVFPYDNPISRCRKTWKPGCSGSWFSTSKKPSCPPLRQIGLRENLQDVPLIFAGKNNGFRLRFSLKPSHWIIYARKTIAAGYPSAFMGFPSARELLKDGCGDQAKHYRPW